MRALAAMLASSALILCACGGGGGGSDSSSGASSPPAPTEPSPSQQPPSQQPPSQSPQSQQPPSQPSPSGAVTLSGVVAADSALAGYGIEVLAGSATPGSVKTVPVEADGRYNAALGSDVQPPFLLHATQPDVPPFPQYPRLYSITNHGGTANVTPLTDLLVARLLNRVPAGSTDLRALGELQNRSDADIFAAQQQLVAYLLQRPSRDNGNVVSPVDVSAVTDFVSMPLVAAPGDPHFEALRRLHASLMDTESIVGVEQHMLFGNDPPADLRSTFALDFLADCTSALPRQQGRLRIIVDRRSTMFGDTNVSHGGGLEILVDPSAGILTWTLLGNNLLQVSTAEGRVSSIRWTDEETGKDMIRCVPVGEVSVAGKYPSAMALIRLLAQSIRNPVIQCAAPIKVPGFVEGANTVAIEQNGALRINGPGGPSFHLPSYGFRIDAGLSMAADGIAPTGLMVYSFGERLGDGTLSMPAAVLAEVGVSDGGRITDLGLHNMGCHVPLFNR
jgi:hypothetical protein